MPRSKRTVRASGVGRSLGAIQLLLTCICCERRLPREAIAFIAKRPVQSGKYHGHPAALCGECVTSGRAEREETLAKAMKPPKAGSCTIMREYHKGKTRLTCKTHQWTTGWLENADAAQAVARHESQQAGGARR